MSSSPNLEQGGLPSSIPCERSILGAILLDNVALHEARSLLGPETFSLDSHRRIYQVMTELAEGGSIADPITVSEELRRRAQLEAVGGIAYIASLTDGVPPRPSIQHYANIVLDKARLRFLINTCNKAIAQSQEGEKSDTIAAQIQEALLEIESTAARTSVRHVSEFLPETLTRMQKEAQHEGLIGLTTGLQVLDEATGGMQEEELWLIGALPNRGKTPLGMQMLMANAENGVPCLMFSLEMSHTQWAKRTLAAKSHVSARQIRRPRYIDKEQWGDLAHAAERVMEWPIWVDDASQITLGELLARARLYIRRKSVKLIVVDYLMLVDAPGKELRQQATAIARSMKALAKTERVTVVLLSQFRRPANINDKPNSSWYKESGDIEAEANVGLAIHRPIENETFSGKDELIITKQREGEIGSLPVTLDTRRLQFVEREPDPE